MHAIRIDRSKPLSAEEMLLGADFLQSHRVLVALSQMRLYFTYLGGGVFRAQTGSGEKPDPPRATP